MRRYNKYGNKKTQTADGIVHDSQKEAQRWSELLLMQRAGYIKDLQRQVKYELIPKQDGERACYYVADFVYKDTVLGQTIVEDVKGFETDVFKIKRKLLLHRYGIKIKKI